MASALLSSSSSDHRPHKRRRLGPSPVRSRFTKGGLQCPAGLYMSLLHIPNSAFQDSRHDTEVSLLNLLPRPLLAVIVTQCLTLEDLLSLASSDPSYLRHKLFSMDFEHIWRPLRQTFAGGAIRPFPEPMRGFTEGSWASFIFDAGECDVCQVTTRCMYASFALPLRLCSKPECRKKITQSNSNTLILEARFLSSSSTTPPYITIAKRIESNWCLYKNPDEEENYPHSELWFRKGEYEARKSEYEEACTSVQLLNQFNQKYADELSSYHETMQAYAALGEWAREYRKLIAATRWGNKAQAEKFAQKHGYRAKDILATQVYGELNERSNSLFKLVTESEWKDVEDALMHGEVLEKVQSKKRRVEMMKSKDLQAKAQKYWETMQQSNDLGYLPTFAEFKRLRTIKALITPGVTPISNNPSDPKVKAAKAKPLEVELRKQQGSLLKDLEEFRENARTSLDRKLDPSWGGTASRTILNPAERVTGLFRCSACDSAPNGQFKKPLDFKAVLGHDCPARKTRRSLFVAGHYTPDKKAIRAVNKVLEKTHIDGERRSAAQLLSDIGARVKCESCATEHPIIMHAGSVAGHARRHGDMQLIILEKENVPLAMQKFPEPIDVGATTRVHTTELSPIDAEAETKVVMPETKINATKWRDIVAFGCRYCADRAGETTRYPDDVAKAAAVFKLRVSPATSITPPEDAEDGEIVEEAAGSAGPSKKKKKAYPPQKKKPVVADEPLSRTYKHYNFDGLKSHLKVAHNVCPVLDEDFYFDGDQCERLGYQKPPATSTIAATTSTIVTTTSTIATTSTTAAGSSTA